MFRRRCFKRWINGKLSDVSTSVHQCTHHQSGRHLLEITLNFLACVKIADWAIWCSNSAHAQDEGQR